MRLRASLARARSDSALLPLAGPGARARARRTGLPFTAPRTRHASTPLQRDVNQNAMRAGYHRWGAETGHQWVTCLAGTVWGSASPFGSSCCEQCLSMMTPRLASRTA